MGKSESDNRRVLSGMRASGQLHLGHYHGVLKNWIKLQHEFDCFFFVADWHGLTTHYADLQCLDDCVYNMVIDWLASGVDPKKAHLFVQSRVPEHAELHLLLSMITPLGWLERVPSYKDQQEKLADKDLATYGFLGYPLLQSADILLYQAAHVPVGEDQVAHIEITREVARRFNHLYGFELGFEEKVAAAIKKLGKKSAKVYIDLRKRFQETGDDAAISEGHALLAEAGNISVGDRERLLGDLEGVGKTILVEPAALLAETSKLPGLDGQKMSKSYSNTLALREAPEVVEEKIKKMPTDPARVRKTDPGNPENCPVWGLHQVYSSTEVKQWVCEGCPAAKMGCLDCKKPLIDAINAEQAPIRERAKTFEEQPDLVRSIIREGNDYARDVARSTLKEVRQAMGLDYKRI